MGPMLREGRTRTHLRSGWSTPRQRKGGTADSGATRNGTDDADARTQALARGNLGTSLAVRTAPSEPLHQQLTEHAALIEASTNPTFRTDARQHQSKTLETIRLSSVRVE